MGGNPCGDLRSDTVTKPTAEMRRAMAEAEVGDDVYGEDPTVNRLEARAAEDFWARGWAVRAVGVDGQHRGDAGAHAAGAGDYLRGALAHLQLRDGVDVGAGRMPGAAVRGDDGVLNWNMVKQAIRPKVFYSAQTALVSCENTHNIAGGQILPREVGDEICDGAHDAGLSVHLDGARVFNAACALGTTVRELTQKFDSVMFCVSKGLGAPVGSLLLGHARVHSRKRGPPQDSGRRHETSRSAGRSGYWWHLKNLRPDCTLIMRTRRCLPRVSSAIPALRLIRPKCEPIFWYST